MAGKSEYVSILVSLPAELDERIQAVAEQRGIEVGVFLQEWIADELARWVPDQAAEIRRSPSFREIRYGAALRELRRIENEYGTDLPGLRHCIRRTQAAISKARAQMAVDGGASA
jgi:hypothetical protein